MITFDPFWKTLKRKNISQYALIYQYHVSTGTLDALRKNKSITLNTLDMLCSILDCEVSDIIVYKKDPVSEIKNTADNIIERNETNNQVNSTAQKEISSPVKP